jgi:hypothetical protein
MPAGPAQGAQLLHDERIIHHHRPRLSGRRLRKHLTTIVEHSQKAFIFNELKNHMAA